MARRLGMAVPTQLSVIGIDDHRNAEMFALTTLRQRPRQQGNDAVRLLLRELRDPSSIPEIVREVSELVVRASTAPSG